MTYPIQNSFLVKFDRVCDCIPVVSTVTNIVDIVAKIVFARLNKNIPFDERTPFAQHLQLKSYAECVWAAIPYINLLYVIARESDDYYDSKRHKYYHEESLAEKSRELERLRRQNGEDNPPVDRENEEFQQRLNAAAAANEQRRQAQLDKLARDHREWEDEHNRQSKALHQDIAQQNAGLERQRAKLLAKINAT